MHVHHHAAVLVGLPVKPLLAAIVAVSAWAYDVSLTPPIVEGRREVHLFYVRTPLRIPECATGWDCNAEEWSGSMLGPARRPRVPVWDRSGGPTAL